MEQFESAYYCYTTYHTIVGYNAVEANIIEFSAR